ncbi:DUF692 domain-containing protein [Pseudomarimonas arenosa]|uniref:UPF0276 protein IFO71_12415 n=1 Tax=Pseudomarimonas arenosa TaxID=2774145 RepID=A0AAW3ZQG1_9GAMM|nr:DUF692 domain-containing protein [Pseudomarimonas arenosa]MBD8526541.1 DUF692 domain-containing protein [Pseudomarimonas arenosa]
MSIKSLDNASAGLGLRRALLGPLLNRGEQDIDFIEVAPENWIGVGGDLGKRFAAACERYPLVCHGLSLSIGGPDALDETFLHKLRRFLDRFKVPIYSEHLSYCTDGGHLYDLMPIPFTEEAVDHVVERIKRTQDILGRRLTLENVSYYAAPHQEMAEIDFINAVLQRSDCELLLDVNNIYVNSINHRYDAMDFLHALPRERVRYIHVAGHYQEADDLIVDTHGAKVIDPVWTLLDEAYRYVGLRPTLLERDFNLPPLADLMLELEQIRAIQAKHDVNPAERHAAA